ncbi:hypothetical protein KR009_004072 [Drosophila setifemur]|nr:hypothetical protein KR009_004072 [Drosophila setifemur]
MMNPFWLIFLFGSTTAKEMHYATSTRDMTPLLELEDKLIGYMRQYANELQAKVDTLRIFQYEWKKRYEQSLEDPTKYVANPQISFPKILEFARREVEHTKLVDQDLSAVTEMELRYAADGFLRLQDIYDLDERDMAKGHLSGTQYNSSLSAADCLALGVHLEELRKGRQACKWFNISLEQYDVKLDPVNRILKSDRSQIWKQMGLSLLNMYHLPASQNAFKKSVELSAKDEDNWLASHLTENLDHMFVHLENCRGKNPIPRKSHLRCRYFTEGSPFLQLAPFKLEQLNLEPFIGIFHDVITTKEQKDLINLSKSRLKLRQVEHSLKKAEVVANVPLNQRIEDISGLNLEESQSLTISHYGIGGQHFIHLDCEQPNDFAEPFEKGYRAATVQLYLSDVPMGGYISFPDLSFGFKPSRGSALVWHNVDNAGNCDGRSLQATCPWPANGSVGQGSGAGCRVGSEGKEIFHSVLFVFIFHFCDNLFNNFVVIYIMIINFMHYFIVFIFNLYAI